MNHLQQTVDDKNKKNSKSWRTIRDDEQLKSEDGMPTSPEYCSSPELLKSLPTSIEVGNSDAGFNSIELGNWFAEFTKKNCFSEVGNARRF